MSKRALALVRIGAKAVGVALFGLVLLVAGWVAQRQQSTEGVVSAALGREIEEGRPRPIVLATLTDFRWDELIVVGPYAEKQEVCERLALSRLGCIVLTDPPMNDGEAVLVFRRDRSLVHSERHRRINGDVLGLNAALTPVSAVFDVVTDGMSSSGKPWRRLVVRRPDVVSSPAAVADRPSRDPA